jgi:SPX domain protein involved in polyphosphate accumulation
MLFSRKIKYFKNFLANKIQTFRKYNFFAFQKILLQHKKVFFEYNIKNMVFFSVFPYRSSSN